MFSPEPVILLLPQLAEIKAEISSLRQELRSLEVQALPEWLDLRQAARLKGVSLSTLQKNPALQPRPELRQKLGKSYKWRKAVIIEWLGKPDSELLLGNTPSRHEHMLSVL